ncbi:MAG: methylenetetrahydrofolate reductase C-terminal domain-containing protein [Thermoplasmatales archaeon]|nr:MAG: methylenetetrahydrofolate reductase C-terminal domain-containing protein [Thermoplasmatales archaeon]
MIITKQKKFEDLVRSVGGEPVFLVGCSECATLCHTGGEEEVLAMKDALEKRRIPVSGWVVLDPACHLNNNKRLLKSYKEKLGKSKSILVLACGNGVQTIKEIFDNKDVISGTDTLFLGEITRVNLFDKRCNLCGECLVNLFGGFCPVSRCPKSMLNGPCGGAKGGKCEINQDLDCVWDQIYNYLKQRGKLHLLEEIQKPKDWSKSLEVRRKL